MIDLIAQLLSYGALWSVSYVLFVHATTGLIKTGVAITGVSPDACFNCNAPIVRGGNPVDRPPEYDSLPADADAAVHIDESTTEASDSS